MRASNDECYGAMPNWLGSVLILTLHAGLACGADALLVPIRGEPAAAKLRAAQGNRYAFRDTNGKSIETSSQEFVRWGSLANPHGVDQLYLSDGSILIGQLTRIRRDAFVLETELWGELTIPRSTVATVLWALPTSPVEQWKLRDRLHVSHGDEEILTLRNGDLVSGVLIEGDRQALKLLSAGGPIDINVELIASWQQKSSQNQAVTSRTEDEVFVGSTDGSQLAATELFIDQQLVAKLRCGINLVTVPGVRPIEEELVCYLRPHPARVKYVSELTPLGYKHVAFLNDNWAWKTDRNVLGGPLSSWPRAYYAKGIGMHSTSRLAYELGESFDAFQAEVCLDVTSGQQGSVVFRVFVLNGETWQEAFKSPTVCGGDAPIPIRVPLHGARRFALVVDFADRGDVLDRANWLGARVVKE